MLKGVILDADSIWSHQDEIQWMFPFMAELYKHGVKLSVMLREERDGSRKLYGSERYREILEEWGVEKEECLAVCDRESSVLCFQELQIPVIGYYSPFEEPLPFLKVENAVRGLRGIRFERLEQYRRRCTGEPVTVLETKRCLVREITLKDLDRLYEIYAEPGMTDFIEPLYQDREEEERFTKAYIKNMYGFYGYGLWIVEDKESGKVIGRAGIENRDLGERNVLELGYLFSDRFRGKGIAFEVCTALIEFSRNDLFAETLHSFVNPENKPSLRLLFRLGFQYIGDIKIQEEVLGHYQLDLKSG